MNQIRMVRVLNSPARDLPADVVLTVRKDISDAVAEQLVSDGYAVEHMPEDETTKDANGEAGQASEKPLDKLKKPELLAMATELGIEQADDMTKPQLIEAIKEKRGEG